MKNIKKLLITIFIASLFLTGCKGEELNKEFQNLDTKFDTSIWNVKAMEDIKNIDYLSQLNIKEIYLNTGWSNEKKSYFFNENKNKYATFIKSLSYEDISVQALLNNDKWATSYSYINMRNQIDEVLSYNIKYKNKFTAIHLNIMPHNLENWKTDYKSILTSYVDNLYKCSDYIDKHNSKYKDNLQLIIDVPSYFIDSKYNINNKPIIELLLEQVDGIVFENYTIDKDKFIENGIKVLKIADNYKDKTIKIGVNIKDIDKKMESTELLKFIKDSITEFNKYDSFYGISIYDFNSYLAYIKNII